MKTAIFQLTNIVYNYIIENMELGLFEITLSKI